MTERQYIIYSYVKFCNLAENSSGLKGRDKSRCVSRRLRALVCSFSTSMVKLEGNHPHCKSRNLSPSYQPVGGEKEEEKRGKERRDKGGEEKDKCREEGGGGGRRRGRRRRRMRRRRRRSEKYYCYV